MSKPAISEELKKETLERLHAHVEENYIGRYGVKDIDTRFKGRFLYIDWIEGPTGKELEMIQSFKEELPPQRRKRLEENLERDCTRSKLCRLRYHGDPTSWEFQIYKYSDRCYDREGEFPFGSGTVEECFDAAASLYITRTFP